MSIQWYWKTRGQVRAPISTHELERLIRQSRISDADQFCLAESDDWMSAAEVKALFAESKDSSSSGTTSESAARLLSSSPHTHLKRPDEGESRTAALSDLLRKGGRGLTGIVGNIGDWLATGVGSLSKLNALLGRKTTLAVLAVLFLTILFKDVELGDTQTQDAFEQFSTTWNQMQAMQQQGVSEAEWKQFQQQTQARLTPTLEALRKAEDRLPASRKYLLSSQNDVDFALHSVLQAGWILQRMLEGGLAAC